MPIEEDVAGVDCPGLGHRLVDDAGDDVMKFGLLQGHVAKGDKY